LAAAHTGPTLSRGPQQHGESSLQRWRGTGASLERALRRPPPTASKAGLIASLPLADDVCPVTVERHRRAAASPRRSRCRCHCSPSRPLRYPPCPFYSTVNLAVKLRLVGSGGGTPPAPMSSRRLASSRGLIDALPADSLRGDRGRPPEGSSAAIAASTDEEDALSSGTLRVRARLPLPRHLWPDRSWPSMSTDAQLFPQTVDDASSSAPLTVPLSSVVSDTDRATVSSPVVQVVTSSTGSFDAEGSRLNQLRPPSPTRPRGRVVSSAVGGGSGAVAAAAAAVAAAADRPAAWAPGGGGGNAGSTPTLGEETIPIMGLSEMQYLRGCFEEISQGQGWVDLRHFCDLCNLLLTHGASSSAETAAATSEPVDEAFDTHTLEFLFRLVDSGRQGQVTLRDWIRASAVFCYGRLVHKLPFVFRFAADDTPEGPTLSTETVQMLIDAVFTVVAAPPGHSWSIARSPAPPGRWPPSHYASGALSVEHNPDTLWASAQELMGCSGHMTYATYLAWAEREPAFSEWVGWVGSRGLRAINVVQSAKERAQFVAEMEMLGFSPTQLATLPASAAATSQWPPVTHPSSTDGSSHRGDSIAGQSSATLLSFEIDFKALSVCVRGYLVVLHSLCPYARACRWRCGDVVLLLS